MDVRSIPRVLGKRKLVLLACALAAAIAALPVALKGPSVFTSTSEALAPGAVPLPRLLISPQSPSILASRLESFLEEGLQEAVKDELGPQAEDITSVEGEQQADFNTYSFTVSATSAEAAARGATAAAEIVIARGNAISAELERGLQERVRSELEPTLTELNALRRERESLTFDLNEATRRSVSLNNQIAAAEQNLARAEAQGQSGAAASFRETIEDLEERADELRPRLRKLEAQVGRISSEVALLEGKRNSLTAVSQEARVIRLSRASGSSQIGAASEPGDADLQEIIITEGIAVLVGFIVGAAVILFVDRARWRREA